MHVLCIYVLALEAMLLFLIRNKKNKRWQQHKKPTTQATYRKVDVLGLDASILHVIIAMLFGLPSALVL